MRGRDKKDIGAIFADGKLIDAALAAGVREALRRHSIAGLPAVEWRDGKTVFVEPSEIKKRIREMDKKKR